ncbi:MAG: hypothetical protein WAQ25_04860 [Candidatus Saccharimonas sp.]
MKAHSDHPDVLYIVKESEDNQELRYSLRSLMNLNHKNVFFAGYKPSWAPEWVKHIPVSQHQSKYQNIRANWLAALSSPELSEHFILMCDDFFIMHPTKAVPVLRRLKSIDHYIELFSRVDEDSYYVKTMTEAKILLEEWGIKNISSYELHVPMQFEKSKLRQLITRLPEDFSTSHIRTIYGNYYNIGGRRVKDTKVINDDQAIPYDSQFLSTIDESFRDGKVGEYIRRKFSNVLVFSHANDPDGLLSVILAQIAFAKVDYVLTNNPQTEIMDYLDNHDSSVYDAIFICDIYPGKPVLQRIPEAYWFDHKQHSLDKILTHQLVLPSAHIEVSHGKKKMSASYLLYLWLLQHRLVDADIEQFVEKIRINDTWDFI